MNNYYNYLYQFRECVPFNYFRILLPLFSRFYVSSLPSPPHTPLQLLKLSYHFLSNKKMFDCYLCLILHFNMAETMFLFQFQIHTAHPTKFSPFMLYQMGRSFYISLRNEHFFLIMFFERNSYHLDDPFSKKNKKKKTVI